MKVVVRMEFSHTRVNGLLKNASLGIEAARFFRAYTLTFKPGEEITDERISRCLKRTMDAFNAMNTGLTAEGFEISSKLFDPKAEVAK